MRRFAENDSGKFRRSGTNAGKGMHENMEHVSKKPRAADFIVLGAITLLTVVSVFLMFRKSDGSAVLVTTPTERHEFSLDTDTTREIKSGDFTLTLVIEDGKAFVSSADCPDKVCVGTGKISRPGQTIVCLPGRVTVTVVGKEADGADFIVG